MPDLSFQIEAAEPQDHAAAPTLLFALRVTDAGQPPTAIHTVALRRQIRIEPARRSYSPTERERLSDLFGTPERWGQTLRRCSGPTSAPRCQLSRGRPRVKLPVPCTFDLSLAATKYFDALEDGDLPLCFLFSGTIFNESDQGGLQVAQISWEKEATFRLPAATWRRSWICTYPNTAWICLRKDIFDSA